MEKEIRDYDPTHIVFITDYKIWIQDSYNKGKCSFEGIVKATINNDKKFGECIEAYGCGIAGTKAKFVVTCRPEGHKEDVFIKEVCECFETI